MTQTVSLCTWQPWYWYIYLTAPCQFLLDDEFLAVLCNFKVHIRFNITYAAGTFANRSGLVEGNRISFRDPAKPKLHYHEVCVRTKDKQGCINYANVDVCHLLPLPPTKKGHKFIILNAGDKKFEGVFEASKVERSTKRVSYWGGRRGVNFTYESCRTVCVLSESESE